MISKKDTMYILKCAKKIKAINLLGGKCVYCGLSNNFILEFHHYEKNKDKIINKLLSMSVRWSEVLKELKKCILICPNCHAELHANAQSRNLIIKKNFLKAFKVIKCFKCSYSGNNIASLEFHHIKGKKLFNISDIFCRKVSVSAIMLINEISKCEIICRNCHNLANVSVGKFKKFKNIIYTKAKQHKEYKKINHELIRKMFFQDNKSVLEVSRTLNYAKSTVSTIIKQQKKEFDYNIS